MPSKLLVARDLVRGHPKTLEQYIVFAVAHAALSGREIVEDGDTLIAYVNDGRWVADCPHCRASIMLDPEWPGAPCLGAGCYRVYRAIAWPRDRMAIEIELSTRPLLNQHWGFLRGISRDVLMPAETLEDLALDKVERRDPYAHIKRAETPVVLDRT